LWVQPLPAWQPAAAGVAAGCGDSTGTNGVTIADLVGDWTATKIEYQNQANTSQTFDIIGIGAELDVSVTSNGNFTGTLREFALAPVETVTGQIIISGGSLTLDFDDVDREDISGTFVLAGNRITLNGTENITFDFTLSGATGVPANIELVLMRQ
jgi:hypothetical protein